MRPPGVSLVLVIASICTADVPVQAEVRNGTSLKASEITKALVGKRISYNPPGWVDSAISEEFHNDGVWSGKLHGRGPVPFSGRWSISDNQICVAADKGSHAKLWHAERYCRQVWRIHNSSALQILYLGDQRSSPNKFGLQTLTVSSLVVVQ
jgi:hypothetical protein